MCVFFYVRMYVREKRKKKIKQTTKLIKVKENQKAKMMSPDGKKESCTLPTWPQWSRIN